jgi:hypothetical protein
MHALSDSRLIGLWERGQRRSAVIRALLLAAESGRIGERDPAELSIGERDAAILRLRAASFGPRLQGYIDCPRCAERLEFDFDCAALLADLSAPQGSEFTAAGLRFRLPNSRDLISVAETADTIEAARSLLRCCCLDAADTVEWTDALLAEIEMRIGALDPAADIRFAFTCSACAHAWHERLDIAAWCWDEVEIRAQRLIDEVHRLALAYGWSEDQVLALGAARRSAYLERCGA